MKSVYRKTKIITIVALVVAMLGISVGFAAFSNVLTISSSAAVKPDSSTFSVLFSSSGTSQVAGSVSGTGSGGATGASATISGTTITGLKANFTAPGQSVTYSFYAHNVGSFLAYLRNVTFGTGKSCTAGTNTSSDMVNAACDDINVSVTVGGSSFTSDSDVVNHSLAIDAYETVVVKITYASNGDVADGDFSVTFGDVSLTYSSVDGTSEPISFTLQYLYSGAMVEAVGMSGMTWARYISSEYNTNYVFDTEPTSDGSEAVLYNGMNVLTVDGEQVWATDIIYDGDSYLIDG